MNSDAGWSVLLLLLALIIIAAELFIPSGGLLAVCAIAAVIASVVLAFKAGMAWGLTLLAVTIVAVPSTILFLLKLLPYTPIGRQVMSVPQTHRPDPKRVAMENLVGSLGVAETDLLPSGIIRIGDKKFDSVAAAGAIDRGSRVEIIRVNGNVIYVAVTDRVDPVSDDPDKKTLLDLGIEELDRPLG